MKELSRHCGKTECKNCVYGIRKKSQETEEYVCGIWEHAKEMGKKKCNERTV